MEATLMSLPSELISSIISYLPTTSLLAFSATCRTNQILASSVFHKLKLAIFSRQMHCELAFTTNSSDPTHDQHNVSRTTNLSLDELSSNAHPALRLHQQVLEQNSIADQILSRKLAQNLKSLSLYMYDLQSPALSSTIATNMPNLRELDLVFCHPYVHDRSFSSNFWREAPDGSPCWNAMAGLGTKYQKHLRLRHLQSLRIERGGITSAQLSRLVESNPSLRELHLDNVTGVDLEFVQWLAARSEGGHNRLEKIVLEGCPNLSMQRLDDFAWLESICQSSVAHLSLRKCRNVRQDILAGLLNDEDGDECGLNGLETFVPPRGCARHYGIGEDGEYASPTMTSWAAADDLGVHFSKMVTIDVDPEFLPTPVAAAA